MAKIDVNLDQIKELEAIPEGLYKGKIEEMTESSKRDKNNCRYFSVIVRLQEEPFVNRKLTANYIPVEGDGLFRFKQLCKSAGIPSGVVTDTAELIGRDVTVRVEQEIYEGTVRGRLAGFA
jgi:hypothetical protein